MAPNGANEPLASKRSFWNPAIFRWHSPEKATKLPWMMSLPKGRFILIYVYILWFSGQFSLFSEHDYDTSVRLAVVQRRTLR